MYCDVCGKHTSPNSLYQGAIVTNWIRNAHWACYQCIETLWPTRPIHHKTAIGQETVAYFRAKALQIGRRGAMWWACREEVKRHLAILAQEPPFPLP